MGKKQIRIFLSILLTGFIILACSFIPGGKTDNKNQPTQAEQSGKPVESTLVQEQNSAPEKTKAPEKTTFTLPPGSKISSNQPDIVIAQVNLPVIEIVAFYRNEYKNAGLNEDKQLASVLENTFSIVFRGSANGKMIVVQGSDLGNGSVAFSIRYE